MKKIMPFILCFALVISFVGCSKESVTTSDLLAYLNENGFSDAHIEKNVLKQNELYLYGGKSGEHLSFTYKNKDEEAGIEVILLCRYNSETNFASIFDAIIPMFDKKHQNGDGEKIYEDIKDGLFESGLYSKKINNITYQVAGYNNMFILNIYVN